jgi:Stress responsive A/B Barrel Domain
VIRHLVFMKYAASVPPQVRDALMRDLASLRSEIDGMEDFRTGRNISPEVSFMRGLTDVFWIDFRDVEARDAYLGNNTHKAIGNRIMASLEGGAEGIFVCDIEL